MRKRLAKILSMIMAFVFCISAESTFILAEELNQPTVKVESAMAAPGENVDVKIYFNNNPGIASLKFNVDYDDALVLTKVEFNSDFGAYVTAPTPYRNPQTISMISPLSDINASGVFATLTFAVSADMDEGHVAYVNLTYDEDDIFNTDYDKVDINVVNGSVTVSTGVPGDVDGDGKVNNKDAILLFRYAAGWTNLNVRENFLDVNGDNKVNTKDAINLFRYVAGWGDGAYTPVPPHPIAHQHTLVATARTEATCTEEGNIAYWYCSECGKYYSNSNATTEITLADTVIQALGHNPVIDHGYPPTDTEPGLTEGSHCSREGCGQILVPQEIIPIPEPETYLITYHLFNGDDYLATQTIDNPNPNYYTKSGLTLKNITAAGYIFEGWYDGESNNATKITKIEAGTTGEIELYAHWSLRTYTVQFDSPLVPVAARTYTVDQGLTLTEPTLGGYNFMGWSKTVTDHLVDSTGTEFATRDRAVLVTSIPKGTTGNITLHANWSSKRNQTIPVKNLENPLIVEDSSNGKIVFAYEIGTIENVPLYQIGQTFQSVEGLIQTYSETKTDSISKSKATEIANTVSSATTNSAAWSLSNDWNHVTTIDETDSVQRGYTVEQAEMLAKTRQGTYSVNSSIGGSNSITNTQGYSAKLEHENSHSDNTVKEKNEGYKFNIDAKVSQETSGGFKLEDIVDLDIDRSIEVGAGYEKHKDTTKTKTKTDSWSNTFSAENYGSKVSTKEKNFNTSMGYSLSDSVSSTDSISKTLSDVIANEKHYGESYATGGSKNESQSFESSNTNTDMYSDTITYSDASTTTVTKSITMNGEREGYYRVVCAGKLHVFGVVAYDVATDTYAVYTFSVMDDETTSFIDYSKVSSSFNDNENGVLPFEIPEYVNDYVNGKIAKSEGLEINISTGVVENYTGNDDLVIVPSYISVDNHDGTFSSVKVTGISSSAFCGKDVVGVCLNSFIADIPEGAFKDCTSLKDVICPNVKTIGRDAFKNCTSLSAFTLSENVETIGENAFENVPEIRITAQNDAVAKAAAASGAKKITVDISKAKNLRMTENGAVLSDNDISNCEIVVPSGTEYFELQGKGKTYINIKVKSDAEETVLNGLTITGCTGIPLTISSEKVTLNRVSITSPSHVWHQSSDAVVSLYGTNTLTSENSNAVVCKNLSFRKYDSSVTSELNVYGNIYIYGSITGEDYLNVTNGDVITLTEEEFNRYIQGMVTYTFNANGGTLSETEKTVLVGENLGTLPIPTRVGYNFLGWSENSTDTSATYSPTASITASKDTTLYAIWSQHTISSQSSFSAPISRGGQIYWYKYTPSSTGTYVIYSKTSSIDTYVELYDTAGNKLSYDDDGAGSLNFRLQYNLTAGTTYYYGVRYYYASQTGTIPVTFGPVYTITYNANGGSGAPSSQSKDYGKDITLSATKPTKSGYYFVGWSIESSATSLYYYSGEEYSYNGNMTLYAVWASVTLSSYSGSKSVDGSYSDASKDNLGKPILLNNGKRGFKIPLPSTYTTNCGWGNGRTGWEVVQGDIAGFSNGYMYISQPGTVKVRYVYKGYESPVYTFNLSVYKTCSKDLVNKMYSSPSTSSTQIGTIPKGGVVVDVISVDYNGKYNSSTVNACFWKVSYGGNTGYIIGWEY